MEREEKNKSESKKIIKEHSVEHSPRVSWE